MSIPRVVLSVLGVLLALLVLGVGVLWWEFTGKEDLAARRYAGQVADLRLPDDFGLVGQDQGGTYFAAGNGPYASRGYRTTRSLDETVDAVTESLEAQGYDVWLDTSYEDVGEQPTIRLQAQRRGDPLEVRISRGVVYDLPFGLVDPVAGHTGVLVVVTDAGRSR